MWLSAVVAGSVCHHAAPFYLSSPIDAAVVDRFAEILQPQLCTKKSFAKKITLEKIWISYVDKPNTQVGAVSDAKDRT